MAAEAIMTPQEKVTILKEHKMDAGPTVDCIDDRQFIDGLGSDKFKDIFVSSKEKGPQLLGGSLALLPVLAETAILSGKPPQDLNRNLMLDVIFQAHKELSMQPTVHMDNHHDDLTNDQVVKLVEEVKNGNPNAKIPGCGFAGLLTSADNPLGLSEPVADLFQDHPDLVEAMVKKGARLIVLAGNHADKETHQALAVRNKDRRKTLDIVGASRDQIQAYNHDDWFFDDLLGRAVEILEVEKKEATWAETLRKQGRELNETWLKKTTQILAGMDPVEF